MGCQHSKLAGVKNPDETLRIETQPTATKYGIECSATLAGGGEPVMMEPEETPQEIRNIRDELFPKSAGSILTIASSSAETSSTTTGYSRSFGSGYSAPSHDDDSTVRQIGYTNTGCRFMDYPRNDDNDVDEEDNESELQPSYAQGKGRSGGRRASFESGNRYHYPASLYEDLKTQKHFVPTITTGNNFTTSSIKLRQQSRTSLPSIRSGITSMSGRRSEDEDEGNSSFASSPGGLSSLGGDFSVDESQVDMFSQFDDALVDTMALSLEPGQKEKLERLTKQSVLSLGALVDKLTEMDGGLVGDDDCGEEVSAILMAVVEEEDGDDDTSKGSSSRSPTVAPSSNSRARAPPTTASKDRCYSAPAPMLEQSDSSELLANMKTLALMTDVQETLARPKETIDDDDTRVSYCSGNSKTLKFHRSSSVAPSSSVSVCSELRWM